MLGIAKRRNLLKNRSLDSPWLCLRLVRNDIYNVFYKAIQISNGSPSDTVIFNSSLFDYIGVIEVSAVKDNGFF